MCIRDRSFPRVKIIVNLAPADLPKRGGRFDLPIALGILQASGQLPDRCLDNLMIVGELGLTGRLRSIHGVLPTSFAFADSAMALFVPEDNAPEALRSRNTRVHCADTLLDAVNQLPLGVRNHLPLRSRFYHRHCYQRVAIQTSSIMSLKANLNPLIHLSVFTVIWPTCLVSIKPGVH